MAGANNEVVEKLTKEFNASQSDYKVAGLQGQLPRDAEGRHRGLSRRQAPDIIQVFDVGTGVMMGAQGAVRPVAEV